jgi:hypothetical protein
MQVKCKGMEYGTIQFIEYFLVPLIVIMIVLLLFNW